MGTIADKLNKLLTTKVSIKNAIITKGQTISDDDTFASYADKILAIETGVQLPELSNPASAAQIVSGYEAIDQNGEIITGSIASKTSSNLTTSGATVTAPAGYYASAASKSVSTATQATPSISVSSSGLITASATQTAGYVSAGTKSAEHRLSSSDDSDFVASNIKSGATIFGVTGTYEGEGTNIIPWQFSSNQISWNGRDTFTISLEEAATDLIVYDLALYVDSSTLKLALTGMSESIWGVGVKVSTGAGDTVTGSCYFEDSYTFIITLDTSFSASLFSGDVSNLTITYS